MKSEPPTEFGRMKKAVGYSFFKSLIPFAMTSTERTVKLEDFKALSHESVRIKDRSRVEEIINSLLSGGRDKLQIITDFDRTLTRPYYKGKECLSSFGIFHLCSKLPAEYIKRANELFAHYRPLEIDPNLTNEEKCFFMEEWTRKEANLLDFELDKEDIEKAVVEASVSLREGSHEMLKLLNERSVPVLVFSAGLGDTVKGVLEHEKVLHPNMHIISNYLKFDGNRVTGLQGEMIHSFNKNENAIRNTDYFHELTGKECVILLGDVLGDAGMADGVKNLKAVLKIGFLQDRVAESLESFMDAFDIVLIDDETMDVANELLQKIL